jgi:uncharacterized protein (DUF1499 family)
MTEAGAAAISYRSLGFVVSLLVLAGAVLAAGRLHLLDEAYAKLFGPPDLGPVAFERLSRRSSPNDALVCPPGECGSAAVDIRPPTYALAANELRRRVKSYFAETGAVQVAADDAELHDRYVARTPLMRFPDTVDVEVFPADADHASLALYSRSQLGFYDFGTNLARLRRLLEALGPGVASASLRQWRG